VSIDSWAFAEVPEYERRGVPAAFTLESGTIPGIVVNPQADYWRDMAGEAKKMRDAKHWASPLTSGPIDHEMGHWLHFDKNPSVFNRQTYGSESQLSAARKFIAADEVSKYASTSPNEFVAETFAGASAGRRMSPGVMKIYESLGGPKIK